MDSFYVGVLFERYADVIYGISLKYLKNRHDAEDMMSQIFVKLTDVLQEKEVDKFRNWLFVLVKNQCVSRLRSLQSESKRQQRYEDYVGQFRSAEEVLGTVSGELKDREQRESEIRRLLESLPEKQRGCIRSFYFEGRSYKEIADAMGEKVGKVRSYIQNGRRNLKIMLSSAKEND